MATPASSLQQRRRPAAGGGGGGDASSGYAGSSGSGNGANGSMASAAAAAEGARSSPTLKQRHGGSGSKAGASNGATSAALSSSAGHRIAFDPRDLNDESEESHFPRLTLMEETLLLGLKDRQGYLSFWNDSISYALRGCIIAELLMRRRLRVVRDSNRMRLEVQDRLVEVVNGKMTGEVLLDEALKLIKASEERRSVGEWIDLLSGETWNLSKIGYQLKQVRERLAKGLVDKGILRTEKRNFLLFDMATHPIADASAKKATLARVHTLVCGSASSAASSSSPMGVGPTSASRLESLYSMSDSQDVSFPALRTLLLVSCAFAANVLDNALLHLVYECREAAFQKVEDWLEIFGQWPMATAFEGGIGAGAGGGSYASNGSASSRPGGPSSRSQSSASRSGASSGPRIAEGSVLPDSDGYGSEGLGGGGTGSSHSAGAGAGLGGPGGSAGFVDSNSIGAATQDLVNRIREKEAGEAGDAMLEGIAGVIAVLSRMDSLL
ncbi:unnamed protein product [Parajaminaea phylloscopi]